MALQGLSKFSFCVLVMMMSIAHQAYGSSRGSMAIVSGIIDPPVVGICSTSVIIHGYKCQEIDVKTQDGFILNIQRIPEGRVGGGGDPKRQPVLIQHGVLVDGMTWLLNPVPEQNLPLILADKGFDVWIANTRGTRFSRRHTSLQPNETDFWNWSWDELVVYDLPAVFGYVYSQTGQKAHYVGHSLGTLIALASFSEGLLVDKLKSAVLLSPIAYLSHMNTALGVVAAKAFVGEITTLFGLAEFNPKGEPVANFLRSLCAYPGVDCYDLLTSITGKNCCLNASTVDLFLKNEPQSTSTKNMVHLAQTVRDGVLAKYNYGNPDFNVMHYGEAKPPIYNLSNIPHNLPIFISYGGQDALADIRDVQLLLDSLKFHDVDKLSIQYIKDYAHADFIMGVNAKDIVALCYKYIMYTSHQGYEQYCLSHYICALGMHGSYPNKPKRLKRVTMEHKVWLLLVFVALITKEALAAQLVVGGSQGWEESTDFNSWASGKKFKVGDQLVFKYTSGLHSVVELGGESAYKNCDLGTALNSMNTGNDVVKLNKPGTRYFACGTSGHCDQGMKVKITVESGTAPSTPESASSSSSPAASSASPMHSFAAFVLLTALVATGLVYMF
ncbi:unnamed protein product [Dovyalis caffra]|uniref:Phytocyanin domain-containing protein n=1 Tax=Dovyalis caffra TaxID=77055 RepID=A0AAV1R3F3_9ROSI|nr:unnamed protein product [Dovyalis caffra]